MSRVTHNTFRVAAASGLVALSIGLAACGGDDTPEASTPASSTPASTSPTTPTATPRTVTATLPDVLKSKVAVTTVGNKAIKAASNKTVSLEERQQQIDELSKKLKAAGFDAKASNMANTGGPIVVQIPKTSTMLIYPTDKYAQRQAAGFALVLTRAKKDARLGVYGNILVATSAPKGWTSTTAKEFKKVQKIAKQVGAGV